jgi:hypothetical protein
VEKMSGFCWEITNYKSIVYLIDVNDTKIIVSYFHKIVMEPPKTSGEIEIHGVVFKGTLPA